MMAVTRYRGTKIMSTYVNLRQAMSTYVNQFAPPSFFSELVVTYSPVRMVTVRKDLFFDLLNGGETHIGQNSISEN